MATPEPISLAQQTKHQFKKKTFYNSRQCAYWYARDCRISLWGEPALTDWSRYTAKSPSTLERRRIAALVRASGGAMDRIVDRRGKRY